jgi:hypothetical protein
LHSIDLGNLDPLRSNASRNWDARHLLVNPGETSESSIMNCQGLSASDP